MSIERENCFLLPHFTPHFQHHWHYSMKWRKTKQLPEVRRTLSQIPCLLLKLRWSLCCFAHMRSTLNLTITSTMHWSNALKTEVPELDGLGFMEDVSGSLSNLLSSPAKEIKCVESIVFSSFNPPPSHRRWDWSRTSASYSLLKTLRFYLQYFL